MAISPPFGANAFAPGPSPAKSTLLYSVSALCDNIVNTHESLCDMHKRLFGDQVSALSPGAEKTEGEIGMTLYRIENMNKLLNDMRARISSMQDNI